MRGRRREWVVHNGRRDRGSRRALWALAGLLLGVGGLLLAAMAGLALTAAHARGLDGVLGVAWLVLGIVLMWIAGMAVRRAL